MRLTLPLLVLTALANTATCTPLYEGSDPIVPRANRTESQAPLGMDAQPEHDAPLEPPDASAPDSAAPSPEPDASTPDSAPHPPDASAATCSPSYGQPCGSCGGTLTCSGGCTVATPPDLGQITTTTQVLERTGGESPRQGELIGSNCPAGYASAGCSAVPTRPGNGGRETAACSATPGRGGNCRCRVRWRADPGVTLRCTVTILTRRVCNR